MKIWVDDIRPAPEGYSVWAYTTEIAIDVIKKADSLGIEIELLDLDHDAGDYAKEGGDYIKILEYMERHNIKVPPIRIHSMNPVGVDNMRAIIHHNGWKEMR